MHLEDIQLCHLKEKTNSDGPDVSQCDILWSCFLFLSVVGYHNDVLNKTEKDFCQEWHETMDNNNNDVDAGLRQGLFQ